MESNQSNNTTITDWKIIGLAILSLRFVQGWIYWGGGSRRFIYAPQKLDPHAPQWMANKMQAAAPGAILGTEHVINFLLQHFYLLYPAIIIFSLVELVCGLCLLFGFFTRAAGFITMLLSVSLMVIFGWQGSTCMDEWTMAVSNVAMGLTLALSGAPLYSIDAWLLRRYPSLQNRTGFVCCASGPFQFVWFKRFSVIFVISTILFTLTTYNYYRGAIFSHYHAGPTSSTAHHITVTHGMLTSQGAVTFTAYVDGGTSAVPSNIIRIELLDSVGKIINTWVGQDLSDIKMPQIKNKFAYNQFKTSEYGLVAPVGAEATITLSPLNATAKLKNGSYQLNVFTINGNRFILPLDLE